MKMKKSECCEDCKDNHIDKSIVERDYIKRSELFMNGFIPRFEVERDYCLKDTIMQIQFKNDKYIEKQKVKNWIIENYPCCGCGNCKTKQEVLKELLR